MIEEASWSRAVEALHAAQQVSVACHVFPDGDALGSMIGVGLYLRRLGKQVWMGWGSTSLRVPSQYGFLPGLDTLGGDAPEVPEVFLAVDCAQAGRLELLQPRFAAARTSIDLDHHATNDGFGDINLVEPGAASSAELAYQLVKRMGGVPTAEEATCFYTGIVTDTGRFMYSSTSPDTLRAAAELRDRGVDHTLVNQEIFESAPFGYLRTLGLVLSRAKLENRLVWSWLTLPDLQGTRLDEAEDMINLLRAVREAEVAALIKEIEPGKFKVSMRSRNDVDVAQIAFALGGGGHAKAAGFPAPGGVQETIAVIREALAPLLPPAPPEAAAGPGQAGLVDPAPGIPPVPPDGVVVGSALPQD